MGLGSGIRDPGSKRHRISDRISNNVFGQKWVNLGITSGGDHLLTGILQHWVSFPVRVNLQHNNENLLINFTIQDKRSSVVSAAQSETDAKLVLWNRNRNRNRNCNLHFFHSHFTINLMKLIHFFLVKICKKAIFFSKNFCEKFAFYY